MFASSNDDLARYPDLQNGTARTFVVGTVPKPSGLIANLAVDSNFYGRALKPNTPHYYQISCGASTVNGTFQTLNLPLGKTYGEPAPIAGGSSTWQVNTSYKPGNLVLDSNGNVEQAQGPGQKTSGTSAPTWAAPGSTTTDGGVTWKNLGSMYGFPSIFTAAQWALSNPHAYTISDPNTGLPMQFVTVPGDYPNDYTNVAFSAVGTCTNWTNPSNLLSNTGFATVTTTDKCAVIRGNTSFTISNAYYVDAVELAVTASSTVPGDRLDACITMDGATCFTPAQQFSLTSTNTAYCFPQTASCGTTPRPKPWSSDWNAPLAPVLGIGVGGSANQNPAIPGISGNSNFGFLVWKDPSATGTISAQNVKTNVFASMQVGGAYPNGGEEWMCNHNSINDGNNVPGYLCMEGYINGNNMLFWINPSSGEIRNLGNFQVFNLTNFANGVVSAPATETFSASGNNLAYFLRADLNHKAHLIKCTLPASGSTAYNTTAGPSAIAPCTWSDLTPNNPPTTYTLQDQVVNFDATYNPTTYPLGGMEGTSKNPANGHTIFTWAALRGNQNAPAWMGAFDVDSPTAGTNGIIAAAPTFANGVGATQNGQDGCRWCGWHTVHNPGDTNWILWAPHNANVQAIGGGFPTDITAGTLDAAINSTQLNFQIDSTANFLQDVAVNDWLTIDSECMQVATVTKGGTSPNFTYAVTVYNRGNSMNGTCPATAASHNAGTTVQMNCGLLVAPNGGAAQTWWNFTADPHLTGNVFLETDNMYAHYAYTAAGTGNVTVGNGISETNIWATCWNYSPGTNCPGGAATTAGNPPFAGVQKLTVGNIYQRHPTSVHQVAATGNELLWGGDIQVANAESAANPVGLANVSGNLYSFTPGGGLGYTYNYKILPTVAVAGFHPLIDVSGPSSTIGGTTADSYHWCYAYKANECVSGSAQGTVYVNAPYLTTTPPASACYSGQHAANVWSAYSESELCFTNYGAFTEKITQVNISTPDTTGAASRALGIGMEPYGFRNAYSNPQPDPSGKWLFFPLDDLNNRADVLSIAVPPWPTQPNPNPGDFTQVPVALNPPASLGVTNAIVEFGYDTTFHCASRQEPCVAVSATYNQSTPFYFENSDSYSGAGCTTTCTIIIPGIIGHVVYYRWKYRDSSNQVLATGPTLVAVAD
jgi:hypothetical protein